MIEFVNRFFLSFAWETGILGEIRQYYDFKIVILTLLGVLACFLGFKIYRSLFSIFTFMITAMGSICFMKNMTDWGAIVTTFSVIGIGLAFFAFRWTYLGAVIINSLIAMGFLSIISNSIIGMIILCVLISIVTVVFPVISTTILTSAFGGIILGELFNLNKLTIMFLVVGGIIIQKFTNQNQKVFEKEYPDKINDFLEKRRKGETIC